MEDEDEIMEQLMRMEEKRLAEELKIKEQEENKAKKAKEEIGWDNLNNLLFLKIGEDIYIKKTTSYIVYYFKVIDDGLNVSIAKGDIIASAQEKKIFLPATIEDKKKFFKDNLELYKAVVDLTFKAINEPYFKRKYFGSILKDIALAADIGLWNEEDFYVQTYDTNERFASDGSLNPVTSVNIRYPKVQISNANGLTHTIRGLIYSIDFFADDSIQCDINGSRYELLPKEKARDYVHSHIYPGRYFKSDQCYGSTGLSPIMGTTIPDSIKGGDYFVLLQKLRLVYSYIPALANWESLEGGPHNRLSNLLPASSNNNQVQAQKYTFTDGIVGINPLSFYKQLWRIVQINIKKEVIKNIFGFNNGGIFIKSHELNNILLSLFVNNDNLNKVKSNPLVLEDEEIIYLDVICGLLKDRLRVVESTIPLLYEYEVEENSKSDELNRYFNGGFDDRWKFKYAYPIEFSDIEYTECVMVKSDLVDNNEEKSGIVSSQYNPVFLRNLSEYILEELRSAVVISN